MTKIDVEHVTKIFWPNVKALDDVTLNVKSGEFMVLLGPSGSGKTTLLRIIAGLEVPTKGVVRIGERVVADTENKVFVPAKDRNVGMVFQNWALYPHMKVFDNIAYPLKLRGLPRREIERRVKEVAKALGIENLLDRYPRQLSGGQQQRVALARALVKQPSVLLLDEPFSNLDARIRVSAREFVKRIQREYKITAILVTHDQADAYALADRIAVIKDGRLQQVGTPLDIYEKPANLFVAKFVGEPPINLIKGEVVDVGGKLYFVAGGLKVPIPDEMVEALRGYVGKEVILGIRPTDIYVSKAPVEDAVSIGKGRIETVEFLGFAPFAVVNIGGVEIRVSHRAYPEINSGNVADVYIKLSRIKLFDAETEKLIAG